MDLPKEKLIEELISLNLDLEQKITSINRNIKLLVAKILGDKINSFLFIPLEDTSIDLYAVNRLKQEGLEYVGDIIANPKFITSRKLKNISGIGEKSFNKITMCFKKNNWEFKEYPEYATLRGLK